MHVKLAAIISSFKGSDGARLGASRLRALSVKTCDVTPAVSQPEAIFLGGVGTGSVTSLLSDKTHVTAGSLRRSCCSGNKQ